MENWFTSKEPNNFYSHLTQSMTQFLNDILKEEGFGLFRKPTQVVFGSSPAPNRHDILLSLTAVHYLGTDTGSLTFPFTEAGEDRFVVFRKPTRMKVSFMLSASELPPQTVLGNYDKLMTYFFDTRTIEPFIPDHYRRFEKLFRVLASQKAELKMKPNSLPEPTNELEASQLFPGRFMFSFDYIALYHSGNPLRQEQKTKQRVVELSNEGNERSVL